MARIFLLGALFIFVSITGLVPGLYAQVHGDPFRELDLYLSVHSNINDNRFHESWNPPTGISGSAELPFYVGSAKLNARYDYFKPRIVGLPDIDQLQISLGWVNRLELLPRLRAGGGFSLLGSVFFFKSAGEEVQNRARNFYGSTSPESEVGVGLIADITYDLSPSWGLRMELNRSVLFTSTKLKLTYVGLGVVKSLQLPKGTAGVLR